MHVPITRVDTTLPLPIYASKGAVCFDISARADIIIQPREIALIPGNVIIQTPEGYALVVAARSSLPRKKGLICPHGIGIIDQDYCGPDDEIMVQVYNITDTPVHVERGERIAQAMFMKIEKAEWQEVDDHGAETRGGFGSTGTHA